MASTAVEALAIAEQRLRTGQLDEAESLCRSVVQTVPLNLQDKSCKRDLAQAHRFLGLVAYLRGQPAVALASVQRALALAPDEAVAHDNLSLFLTALGRPVEAEKAARQA